MNLQTIGEKQPWYTWIVGAPFLLWTYWHHRAGLTTSWAGWWNRPRQPVICRLYGVQLCYCGCPDTVCCDNPKNGGSHEMPALPQVDLPGSAGVPVLPEGGEGMIIVKRDVYSTQAYGCLACIQVGTTAILVWPDFHRGPCIVNVAIWRHLMNSLETWRDRFQFRVFLP